MKYFFICIFILLFATSSLAVESDSEGVKIYGSIYIYALGGLFHKSDIDNNTKFPLYCGYLVVTNKEIKFVKKTSLPLGLLDRFFDKIIQSGQVVPYQPVNAPYIAIYHDPVPLGTKRFYDEIIDRLQLYHMYIFFVAFEGEPDENYSPEFSETCIYNNKSNPPRECYSGDFSMEPSLLLLPTSNEDKIRAYVDHKTGDIFIQEFNMKTKKWEREKK
jgi:hypothetical protein